MSLRRAIKSDAASLAVISMEVWVGTYLKRGVNAFFANYALGAFTSQKMEALIADPSQFILVSENEEGIDGFIRVAPQSQPPIQGLSNTEIATFYVQPRHHGKGKGKQLLNAALQYCRDQDIESVWLTTNAENDPAIGFYLSFGFEHTGTAEFRIQDQGYLNNVYVYQLHKD